MVLPNGSRPNDFIVLMRSRVISIDARLRNCHNAGRKSEIAFREWDCFVYSFFFLSNTLKSNCK